MIKDMGLTHAEFFRTVQTLLAGREHSISTDGVTLRYGSGVVEIRLEPEGTRRLGNFSLPQTRIHLAFPGCTSGEADAFLRLFERAFHRGGG